MYFPPQKSPPFRRFSTMSSSSSLAFLQQSGVEKVKIPPKRVFSPLPQAPISTQPPKNNQDTPVRP